MLLFRAEEHVDRWTRQWGLPRGAILSLEHAWRLASAWFAIDRGTPEWRRFSLDETEGVFRSLNLTEGFWNLRT